MGTERALENKRTLIESFFNLILCEQCAPAFSTWYYVNSVHQLFQLDTMWTVCTSFFNSILCEQCAPAFSTWYYVNSVHQLFQLDTMWTVCTSFFNLILCEQCAPAFSTWYYVNSVCQLPSQDLGHIAPDNFPQDKILHGGVVSGSSSACTQKWTCSCLTGWGHCRSYILHV